MEYISGDAENMTTNSMCHCIPPTVPLSIFVGYGKQNDDAEQEPS